MCPRYSLKQHSFQMLELWNVDLEAEALISYKL